MALLRVGRRPWPVYAELVEEAGSARAVLARELTRDENEQITLLDREAAPLVSQATADITMWTAAGIHPIAILDPAYPENLRAVHDRPPLIFVAGKLLDRDRRSVALIGTRHPSDESVRIATETARRLSTAGFTIVSGLAAGIDTSVHEATLDAGGRTVAVIGTGLNHSYPPHNAKLQRRIAQTGAVVSQFWPHAAAHRGAFALRNATMSGLALATVVIEASQTSGARIQARRALAHGRPVLLTRQTLAIPWTRELSRRPGTQVIDVPDQVVAAVDRLKSIGTLIE